MHEPSRGLQSHACPISISSHTASHDLPSGRIDKDRRILRRPALCVLVDTHVTGARRRIPISWRRQLGGQFSGRIGNDRWIVRRAALHVLVDTHVTGVRRRTPISWRRRLLAPQPAPDVRLAFGRRCRIHGSETRGRPGGKNLKDRCYHTDTMIH